MADKAQLISSLVEDLKAATAAGRSVNVGAVVAAHPHLMPELQIAIDHLYGAPAAGDAPGAALAATIARPVDPNATIARPVHSDSKAGKPAGAAPTDAALGTHDSFRDGPTVDAPGVSHPPSTEPFHTHIHAPGYSINSELSRGGQAVVFLATQLSTGRKVALKVMRDGPLADDRAMARFQREVEILAALNHPNIVGIIDTGKTSDGSQFIAMNYIAGVSLGEYMQQRHRKDPTDPGKLLRTFYKICMAVNEAHVRGIVHRDLKPNNIRVDERGEPHVLDFGLARTALDRFIRGSNHPVSISGEFLGSLPWSSPEQAEGNPDRIDIRTDVYSLGVILYQMLTGGRFPYEVVGNIRNVLNNILTTPPTPPSQLPIISTSPPSPKLEAAGSEPKRVNEAIERVVLKALAKSRERRYQSAGELGKDVANYLLGKPIPAQVAPPGSPSSQPSASSATGTRLVQPPEMIVAVPRRRKMALVGGSVAAVLIAGVCMVAWPKGKSQQASGMSDAKQADATNTPASGSTGAGPTPVATGGADARHAENAADPELQGDIEAYERETRRGYTLPFFEARGPLRYRVWLQEAEQGNTMAQVFVARCLFEGVAVPTDRRASLKWFQTAADKGNSAAQLNMGYYYETGEGNLVPKDPETAVQFYRQSAAAGNATAMSNLGSMYRDGEGRLPVNAKIAAEWFEKAAKLGNLYAMRNLSALLETGAPGVPQDKARAKQLTEQAAKDGDEYAQGYLAAQPVAAAFQAYTATDATAAQRAKALDDASQSMACLDTLGLNAVIRVLSDSRIQMALDSDILKDPKDPLRQLENKAVDRAIDLFRHSSRATRRESLSSFADITSATVAGWQHDGDVQRVADFWRDCFSDLNFAENTAGEKDKTVNELGACILSLLTSGDREEAMHQLDDALKLADAVLTDRPWDWYTKESVFALCFDVGQSLAELNDDDRSQALLRRGWAILSKMYGCDGLLERNRILPLKGNVPADAIESDKAFFESFKTGSKSGGMKRFTIPCDFNGVKYPFYVYVLRGKHGYLELQDQFRWVREYRGGIVPKEVVDSFAKLNKIAVENNVDFCELTVYALGTTTQPSTKPRE